MGTQCEIIGVMNKKRPALMTFPTISDQAVAKVLILLAINAAWLIICLIAKVIDMAISMITPKLPDERIGYLYLNVAIAINVIYAIVTLYAMVQR